MAEPEPPESLAVPRKDPVSIVLPVVVGVGLLALLAFGLFTPRQSRPEIGDPAPDFALTLFDGSEVSLTGSRGQVIVLNFWASWCAPCRNEAPELQRVWEMFHDQGLVMLGVTYQDAARASQAFVQANGITYPNGLDPKARISRTYAITGVPETFVIDRDGNIAWFHIGELDAATLIEQLERLL